MILNGVLENIQLLQCELQKISSSIQNEIASVIIDGSVVRGDFIENSSDIDITIFHKNVDLQVKKYVEEVIEDLYNFYLNKENTKLLEGNFRKKLCDFSLNIIQRYYLEVQQLY